MHVFPLTFRQENALCHGFSAETEALDPSHTMYGKEVHCRRTHRQKVSRLGPWGSHSLLIVSPIRRALAWVRRKGRRGRAQVRPAEPQLKGPMPSPAFPGSVQWCGSRSLRRITLLSNYSPHLKLVTSLAPVLIKRMVRRHELLAPEVSAGSPSRSVWSPAAACARTALFVLRGENDFLHKA